MTASGGERVALVEAVAPFLDDWQALLKDIRMLTPERANAMLDRAENLRHQADAAGQGSIVHQLEVCIGCLKAPALDRRGFQEALRSLSEVTWQLKQELGPLVRRGSGAAADAGPRSFAPPPLLSDQGAPVPSLVSRGGFEPPPPLSLPGVAPRFEPPPNLSSPNLPAANNPSQNRAEPPRAASPAPVVERPAPQPAPAPARPFEAAGPSIIPLAGNRAPQPSPQILGPRGNAPAPAAKGKDKPNLMVATMFGLRAFGRGKGGPSAPPAAAPGNAPQILGRGGSGGGGVLGLGRRQHNEPSGAPEWIGPRAGGLPELASGGPPPAAHGAAADIDQRLRQLRGQDEPRGERRPSSSSSSRSSRPPTVPPGGAARARSGSGSHKGLRPEPERKSRRSEAAFPIPWWIGAVAVAVVGLVVVGLLVFGRTSPSASLAPPAAAGDPGAGAELPTSRLLDDKERMRALISLVHSYGGAESPELADLVNEEAALVYEVLERSCDQPGDKCERPAPMIAGTVRTPASPQHEIHHLFEDRKLDGKTRASGQVPKWLAGLQMPAIGTADEASVRRSVEYYTSNQSGREEFQNMLFRCGAYQDLIEKTLVHYGMPRALLALVMTESGCVPHAESPVGARGLWQFMPATARAYHLNVKEDVIDERISPPKSTEAAVKYLADLYRKMGSWEFALASYNMGPFGLSARIRRAGGDVTFWDLAAAGYLPDETAKYVPRIQAYALILENLGHFNFSTAQMRATEVTGELEAPPGTRLGMVARASSTSLDHLRLLNPDIVGTSVPDLPGTRFMVQVPKEDVLRAQSVLEQLLAAADQRDRCVPSAFDWGSERFTDAMCAPPGKPRKPR